MIDLEEMTTDQSLLASLSEHKEGELKLLPYSLMRQVIAADLCDRGAGGFWCAVMTVWVCTLNETQALEAHEDLLTAKARAFEWAEAKGYNYGHYKPLTDLYLRLQREVMASTSARVNGQEPEPSPNAGGQPG